MAATLSGHHANVPERCDRARAARRLEGAVEHRQVLRPEVGGTLDRLVLVDVVEDLADLLRAIAELAEGRRDRLVDDLEEALADELLVLDEGDVGLDAGGIAIHEEADRPAVIGYPPPAQVAGVLYNAIFLDQLDSDALQLQQINKLIARLPESERDPSSANVSRRSRPRWAREPRCLKAAGKKSSTDWLAWLQPKEG